MRILIVVGIFALGCSAFAMPTVGDHAVYVGTDQKQGAAPVAGSVELEIKDHNTTNDQYLVRATITTKDQAPQVTDKWTESKNLLSDSKVQQALQFCSVIGGQKANLTVPAGTFDTCAVPVNDKNRQGTVWVGQVPFGVVQADITTKSNGEHTVGSLSSFHAGFETAGYQY